MTEDWYISAGTAEEGGCQLQWTENGLVCIIRYSGIIWLEIIQWVNVSIQ